MKKYTCPDCGNEFQEGFVPSSCPNCGCPSDQFKVSEMKTQVTNTNSLLESSNDFAAEKLGAVLANIAKVIAIIIAIGSVLVGFIGCISDESALPLLIIPGGLIIALLFITIWAWLRLMVNISYRLTRIDNKTKAE